MNSGKYVSAQIMSLVNPKDFAKCVARYQGDARTKRFTWLAQFLRRASGSFSHRRAFRTVVLCLEGTSAKGSTHMGISNRGEKSTPLRMPTEAGTGASANFALVLIQKSATPLPGQERHGHRTEEGIVYALSSTTIELCLDVFWWARFRKHKAAVGYTPCST
ncbi:MAG: DUF4372 domain-containing protein [Saprospiraceae bacterium]|nr:DUF4372 domain-containing protein [Saprospiraceae bacterium]